MRLQDTNYMPANKTGVHLATLGNSNYIFDWMWYSKHITFDKTFGMYGN